MVLFEEIGGGGEEKRMIVNNIEIHCTVYKEGIMKHTESY
jgi:hypothetical protein